MKKEIKVLLVEDDSNLGSITSDYLKAKGFNCTWEINGELGYREFVKNQYDIVILDVMMPVKDGFSTAKDIRGIDKKVPIIFLTAKSLKEDTLKGFEIGADDYITKPFNMEELIARISAILKRVSSNNETHFDDIKIGKLTFNPKMQVLSKGEFSVSLTTKESDLLILLYKNKNDILERDHALKAIWGDDNYFNGRSMDVYIYLLTMLGAEVNIVAPTNLMPKEIEKFGVNTFTDMKKGLKDCDIVMMLRLQNERMTSSFLSSNREYYEYYGLTPDKLDHAKSDAIIMHPGPMNRGIEIDTRLADDINKSVIKEQVELGVAVRMACLKIFCE